MECVVLLLLHWILALCFFPQYYYAQILSFPAINIAQGKKIEATSTCGVNISERELFCKLATPPGKLEVLGLSCDHCDPVTPSDHHPIEYAIDGSERWWQSPPLSRGLQFQQVNITIDLGQEYQVAYVIIKTGNAPRPGTWALEKSIDGGKTFKPWQYFATTNSECLNYFGISSLLQSFKDDTTVTCTTSYSHVPPFENGEIHISLVNGRPGAANFSYSQALQQWTRATHIRLRLLKVKTLLADLLPLARQDPSVTRRYFYSIKDISVGGICMCNGHADACVQSSEDSSPQFVCQCKHMTCGIKCEQCCPGFVQKPWKPATPDNSHECERCNCHNHTTDCYYDERISQARRSLDIHGNYEGGGVCVNCQHNTDGINCEKCKRNYYRPTGVPKTSSSVCQACTCDRRFSTGDCFDGDGRCECRENYSGPRCDQCNEGFYGFPNCKPCDCHPKGTSGQVCGPTGDQCPCNPGYTGPKCDQCATGYYGFPDCRRCNCDFVGSLTPDVCDVNSGNCTCRQMYTTRQCNQCNKGFYSFPECKVCNCDSEGVARDICDPNTGSCICMVNFAVPRCDVCNAGYYRFPTCDGCGCSDEGSLSPNCTEFGVCSCKDNYDGAKCDRCKVGYYSYPRCVKCACDLRGSQHQFCDPSSGQCTCKGSFRGLNCNLCRPGYYGFPDCQACRCDPAGIKPLPGFPLGDCSLSNEGQCDCKDNVGGLICTECKDGYFSLQSNNTLGCDSCDCNLDGVIGGLRTCDKLTGQCPCKLYVTGRRCTACKAGFYGLAGSKVFGCTGCDCDVGGAYDQYCDAISGKCRCRSNVTSRDCTRPTPQHFYPMLLHIKAELEDGTTAPTKQGGSDVLSPDEPFSSEGSPARFGFDESVFPGHSWRGYASMSDLQRALKVSMDIPKTARYHIVFRYLLNESSPVMGEVMFTPKRGAGSKQSSKVTFPVTPVGPAHQIVGEADLATQFMLTKGKWDLILLMPPANVLLDYVVALPQEYYEAYQLEEKVTNPCKVNGIDSLCNQFSYLSLKKPELFTAELVTGYIIRNRKRVDTQLFKNESVLEQLDFNAMALLDSKQNRITADFSIPKLGKYVLVLQYFHPSDGKAELSGYLRYPGGTQRGYFNLQSCNYRFGCRQVAVNVNDVVKVFDVEKEQRMVVTLVSRASSPIALHSITAIPLDMWTLDFIEPNILCTTKSGVCIPTSYPIPKGAIKIDVNGEDPNEQQPPKQDPETKLQYLKGPVVRDFSGSIPRPGKYAVIVHYYQPMHSSFDSQVSITSDVALDGTVKFHYCPHTSGCRSVVRDANVAHLYDMGRTSVGVEFTIPENASTWIDYVLLVPENAFSTELQEDSPVPLAKAFLDSCSKDSFFIKPTDRKLCKESAFSLTTSFNDGAFACGCNLRGSYHNDCQEFGGQCSCRPNVIGRTCSRCKTGYYGFPNCRQCRCVYCNEITGACDCPTNTVGPNCELCLQGSYGHDPIFGCKDCECERNGVIDGNLACDAKTGQCICRPSHTGRQCDKCATGYYNYPLCQKCELCDERGVDKRVCDADNGKCFCKPGVRGERCDKCAAEHFNLDANNPNGCTKCWCNGLSDTCFSGNKYWSKVNSTDDWGIENTPASVVKIGAATLYSAISSQRNEKDKPVYWVASQEYLGKKISSYGGKLTYKILYEVPQGGSSPVLTVKPDVVMEGKNGKVLQYRKQAELSPGQSSSIEVQFLEYLWEDVRQLNVSRSDFMSVLLNVNSLKLRATYSTEVSEVTISDVLMEVAVQALLEGAERAKSVEVCDCPDRATGASCELCGKGFTRGADNSSCIPCNCFGHSSDCHDETGECYSCLHNTTGRNCDVCVPGFYGDATTGSPDDCSICECPLGTTSNSFATSCSLDSFKNLLCICQEGYVGERCESCADGYYGNPSDPGDYCTRCTCSGNIDSSVNGSCDSLTGRCLKCTNAATGDQCENCLNGYYGDAVIAKNCARCACSECGTITAVCNHTIGACNCKPNVIGEHCDSCKPNTWNFDSCLGCEDCDCSPVSLSSSCDVKTGQCNCPLGVTGRKCDRCKAGYFGRPDDGCQACNCEKGAENLYGFCDVNTGQCCKKGGNCTICPVNYIPTAEGCEYCGECVGRLLSTVTDLDRNVTLALKSLKQGTAGIIAELYFKDVNETLQRLIPPTNKYNSTMEAVSHVVGISASNDVGSQEGLMQRAENYEKSTEELNDKAAALSLKAAKVLENSTSTKEEALELEQNIKDALNRTQDIIDVAKKLANTLKTDKANQTLLLATAEEILSELTNREFFGLNATISVEQELVMTSLSKIESLFNETLSLWSDISLAGETLDILLGIFGVIQNKTSGISKNASHAMETNDISRNYDPETPLTEAVERKEEVDIALVNLQDVVTSTKSKLMSANSSLQAFNGSFLQLDNLINQVNKRMSNLTKTVNDLTPSVLMAQNHSEELQKQADELEKLLTDIDFAQKAVNASQRYSDIATSLNESLAIAREAEKIAMDAIEKSQNVTNQAKLSQNRSSLLNETASYTQSKVDNELSSLLDDVKRRLEEIRRKIMKVSTTLSDVESTFPGFDDMANDIGGRADELESNATGSKNTADDAKRKAEEIEAKLKGLSELKKSINATQSNITNTESKLRQALDISLNITDRVVIQEIRHERIIEELDTNVKLRLDDIDQMLKRAHTLLRFTSFGMKFNGKTFSKPVPPVAIQRKTRSLDVLVYAKPEKPDGLVMFMGDTTTSDDNRQKRQAADCETDFVAVELKGAKPCLKICTFGNYRSFEVDENITTDGTYWYKVQASMTGNKAKLSFDYYEKNNDENSTAVSLKRSLDMKNPQIEFTEHSEIILGGVPLQMELPSQLSSSMNYSGCLDGLQVNHHFVGTWNSDHVEATTCSVKAAEANPSRTFFGTGYLTASTGGPDPLHTFEFKFTTSSSDGLLLIAFHRSDPSLFQAVELSDGFLVYSYNTGCGNKQVRSTDVYDTGKEVLVEKMKSGSGGFILKITSDGKNYEISSQYCSKRPKLVRAKFVYWGGIENRTLIPSNVTSQFFKGCMSDMTLRTGEITVQSSPGYIPGCQLKPAENVRFLSNDSFLEVPPFLNNKRGFGIGLSFKVPPATKNGLLFWEAHQSEEKYVALGLVDGKVTFQAKPEDSLFKIKTDKEYNDDKWHFVAVNKNGAMLEVFVDAEVLTINQFPQYFLTRENMYLGGVPRDYTVMTENFESAILESLQGGSIRDLTFDDRAKHYAKAT
ncbi:laminin subunit alpha-like [Montipora foliosa]|uniref:laminin subunit alpha-like n=1 Tax=Montipora foliosa TaxID=591990 RepID=UPI0035F1E35B